MAAAKRSRHLAAPSSASTIAFSEGTIESTFSGGVFESAGVAAAGAERGVRVVGGGNSTEFYDAEQV
jgi:hypothetical protein